MCNSPSLDQKINESEEAKRAAEEAIKKAQDALENTKDKATEYINANTNGFISEIASNNTSYCRYSDEFSLNSLNAVVDSLIDNANAILDNSHASDKESIKDITSTTGGVIKSALNLFASSSQANQKLQVSFIQFRINNDNYAAYYASNSMSVDAQNVWGNKSLLVNSNMYMLAQVQPNPAIGAAETWQACIDQLVKINSDTLQSIGSAKSIRELKQRKALYEEQLESLKAINNKLTNQLILLLS